MTASNTERALLDFIGPLLSDSAIFESFSALTGYASRTQEDYRTSAHDDWADRTRIRSHLDDGSILTWALEHGFSVETPTSSGPTRVADLKPGDVVILTGEAWTDRMGQERTIRTVDLDGAQARFEEGGYADDADWTVTLKSSLPEPPELSLEEALRTGAYHSALLPMMEKISQAADTAGYCAEYDRMARSVGAPTRAEVRRLVGARDGRRRRVDVTIPVTVTFMTEGPTHTDEEALAELRDALSTWPGIIDLVTKSIEQYRWQAVPTGGSIPEDARVTVI
jgi:hypothetical protein